MRAKINWKPWRGFIHQSLDTAGQFVNILPPFNELQFLMSNKLCFAVSGDEHALIAVLKYRYESTMVSKSDCLCPLLQQHGCTNSFLVSSHLLAVAQTSKHMNHNLTSSP